MFARLNRSSKKLKSRCFRRLANEPCFFPTSYACFSVSESSRARIARRARPRRPCMLFLMEAWDWDKALAREGSCACASHARLALAGWGEVELEGFGRKPIPKLVPHGKALSVPKETRSPGPQVTLPNGYVCREQKKPNEHHRTFRLLGRPLEVLGDGLEPRLAACREPKLTGG